MDEFLEIAARLAGVFYAIGGLIAIRTMAVSEMLDRALNMITLKPEPAKVVMRRWLLGTGAVLTGASGVAAALLSFWAVPLFAANAILQAGWLAWARTAFPPEDEEDAVGRRRTTNAALGCAALTLLVLHLWRQGRLAGAIDPWTAVPTAIAMIGYGAYLARSLLWRSKGGWDGGGGDGDDAVDGGETVGVRHPARIRFVVHPWRYPIVDANDNRLLNHFELLDIEDADRIEAWHDHYAELFIAAGDAATAVFATPEDEAAHRAEAEAHVALLGLVYGRANVEGPIYVPVSEVLSESAF